MDWISVPLLGQLDFSHVVQTEVDEILQQLLSHVGLDGLKTRSRTNKPHFNTNKLLFKMVFTCLSHLDGVELPVFIGHQSVLGEHVVHALDHCEEKAQRVKGVHHRLICERSTISPSSPSCSWIFTRSDPPTTPTRTRVLSFLRNSFVSGVAAWKHTFIQNYTSGLGWMVRRVRHPQLSCSAKAWHDAETTTNLLFQHNGAWPSCLLMKENQETGTSVCRCFSGSSVWTCKNVCTKMSSFLNITITYLKAAANYLKQIKNCVDDSCLWFYLLILLQN